MITVEMVEYKGFNECVRVAANGVELIVTTHVGPRILSYTKDGGANHMKNFEEQMGKCGGAEFTPYGGHRVWHAPEQKIRSYDPDNFACELNLKVDGAIIMSGADRAGIIKGMEITMSENGDVVIENILMNAGLFDVELSVWGLTQFCIGGMLAVPNSQLDTGLIGNRCVSMWPYSKMNDRRVYWGDKFITVTPDAAGGNPFKFGASCDEGYAAYFNHGQMVIKEIEYYYGVEYPNYYCNFESYTNSDFIEIESLSPLLTLEAGEETRLTEKWIVVANVVAPKRDDEKGIQKALDDYAKKAKKQ